MYIQSINPKMQIFLIEQMSELKLSKTEMSSTLPSLVTFGVIMRMQYFTEAMGISDKCVDIVVSVLAVGCYWCLFGV